MRFYSITALLCAGLSAVVPALAESKFYRVDDQRLFTFRYETDDPHKKNWIGIYEQGKGPKDGAQVDNEDSLHWEWASGTDGEVVVDAKDDWPEGKLEAFYCRDDGYESLADWFEVDMPKIGFEQVDGEQSTFIYGTVDETEKNWIGLFTRNNRPDEEGEKVGEPTLWAWANGPSGRVTLGTMHLNPTPYYAYYFSNDGYSQIMEPIQVDIPTRFVTDKRITLRTGRVGEMYELRIYKYLPRDFSIIGLTLSWKAVDEPPSWLRVTPDGIIKTVPPQAGSFDLTIRAYNQDREVDIHVTLPVAEEEDSLVKTLRAMTYNLWDEGKNVNNYQVKQAAFILESNVDVVGIQETSKERSGELADMLDWYHSYTESSSNGSAILSRYPIEKLEQWDSGSSAKILISDKNVTVFNVHLTGESYSPDAICNEGLSVDDALKREEESGRTEQLKDAMNRMGKHLENADDEPVLLMGDFNAPSRLDWTDKNKNCGVGEVRWPTSVIPLEAGMADSLFDAESDPEKRLTFSPISEDGKMKVRTDFIYHKGASISIKSGETVVAGEPKTYPDHADNQWTSDHKAVIIEYGF